MKKQQSTKQEEEDYDYSAKVLIIGDSKVGKSSLLLRYVHQEISQNPQTTVAIDYRNKVVNLADQQCKVRLQLWDTAGQERFRPILTNFYKNTKAAIIVFDITDSKSLEDLKYWVREINNHTEEDLPKIILGNKIDLDEYKNFDQQVLSQISSQYKIPYFFVSALTGVKVEESFTEIAVLIAKKYDVQALAQQKKKQSQQQQILKEKNIKDANKENFKISVKQSIHGIDDQSRNKGECC